MLLLANEKKHTAIMRSFTDLDTMDERMDNNTIIRTVDDIIMLLKDKVTHGINYRVFRNGRLQYFQCLVHLI